MGMIVAGVGCQTVCSTDEIVALVRRALAACGEQTACLATATSRATLPAMREAADVLGLSIEAIDHAALLAEQPRCKTVSPAALRATGLASVAEAAALAAAGPGSRLILPRIASARATCAIAVSAQ
jgi:cobalt-precorrin 5A hydrolase